MQGKEKCRILKQIRQRIADENDIPYVTRECSFRGECRGTCPRCERELLYLERQLALRASLGKRVAVAALCASLSLGAASCAPFGGRTVSGGDDLSGMIEYTEPSDTPQPEIEVETGEIAWPKESGDLEKDGAAVPPGEAEEWELTGDVLWLPEENGNG